VPVLLRLVLGAGCNNYVVLSLYNREVVIKGFKPVILVKSVVIIYTVNLQYVFITRIVNVNYGYYGYKVQNR